MLGQVGRLEDTYLYLTVLDVWRFWILNVTGTPLLHHNQLGIDK